MAASSNRVVSIQSKGIYHGLPVFAEDIKGLTAIVTGTSGISGSHMARVLAESPERWSKIYCISRRAPDLPDEVPSHVEHVKCDFLQKPEEIAEAFEKQIAKIDYVFYSTYAEPTEGQKDPAKLTKLNVDMLENFLRGLQKAGLKPKTVLLQTGGKYYGQHYGPTKQPAEEWQPRIEYPNEPNFYYGQEDALRRYCTDQSPATQWTITMPGPILGAVDNPFMNFVYPLALYASVRAHKKQPLIFPGSIHAWRTLWTYSTAKLNAYLNEWVVLTDLTQNERFNTSDGSSFTIESFWPQLASWFGLEWEAPVVYGKEEAFSMDVMNEKPPRGYGPRAKFQFTPSMGPFSQWAATEFTAVWTEIVKKHGLRDRSFKDEQISRMFQLADFMLLDEQQILSVNKARKMGWHGFVDSAESIREAMDEFAARKMIPPMAAGR